MTSERIRLLVVAGPAATVPLLRSITVAEHAMAILLTCARKIVPGHLAVTQAVYRKNGCWWTWGSMRAA